MTVVSSSIVKVEKKGDAIGEREGERDVRCVSKEGQMHRVISEM